MTSDIFLPLKEDSKRTQDRRSKPPKQQKSSPEVHAKELHTFTLSVNDYYERNIGAKSLCYVPIFLFDLCVTEPRRFEIEFSSHLNCLRLFRILVLAPNGRVIARRNKSTRVVFDAQPTGAGTYVIKYWMGDLCSKNFALMRELPKPQFVAEEQRKVVIVPGANLFDESKSEALINRCDFFHLTVRQWTTTQDPLKGSIDITKSGARVHSLLCPGREGSRFKGEKLKEKNLDRYNPPKALN